MQTADLFKTITPAELQLNVFDAIGKNWMLVTAERDGKANTMTASWGGLGVMWDTPVAFVVIRPTRYTKEFVDNVDTFSLSFLDHAAHAKDLGYLGSVSGRDEDKIKKTGLTLLHQDGTPFFREAQTVLLCRKLFAQYYLEDSIIDHAAVDKWYPEKDYHMLYISKVQSILVKK